MRFTTSGVLYAGIYNDGIFKSTDNGVNWSAINSGLTIDSVLGIYSLAVCGDNILVGTGGSGVSITDKNEINWSAVNPGPSSAVFYLLVNDNAVFAGYREGIFRSTDDGKSWTEINVGLQDTFVRSLASYNSMLFTMMSDTLIYTSSNNGTSWTVYDSGFRDIGYGPYDLSVPLAASNGNLYVGTSDRGVWRRPIAEMVPVRNVNQSCNNHRQTGCKIYTLSGVDPAVIVAFNLSRSEKTSITVHDLSGKRIATLVNRRLSPGSYRYRWNAGNVAPGFYMVTMQEGKNTYFQKVAVYR